MLGNQIISLRKKKRMSQAQLAKILNISPSAIGMYEQGRRDPSIHTLVEMAKLFEVSLDFLITGNNHINAKELANHKNICKEDRIVLDSPCRYCYWGNIKNGAQEK